MMTARKSENWLLVEWNGGGKDVVYIKSVLSPLNKELKPGDLLTANRKGEAHAATLIARARERHMLDSKITEAEPAGPSMKNDEEPDDFSASGSSWEPSDDGAMSADSDAVVIKKVKLEKSKRQYSNRRSGKKILTPSNKVNAVIPKCMQKSHSNSFSRKRSFKEIDKSNSVNKSLADSTKKYNGSKVETSDEKVTIDVRELINIRNSFKTLFNMIDDLKKAVVPNYIPIEHDETLDNIPIIKATETIDDNPEELKEEENNDSEEFDRSDDNVLITNKYDNQRVMQVKSAEKKNEDKEWIPIGSGKTLIHVDQFKKVNWRSYTIATRSLLLAVFPRRILATHSLTGKRSPAFQDKPAKMCLDPKIISDVIMEIMDRFLVKENLVRSIITTKCADECKMWKTRLNKKKSRSSKNQENVPPETNGNYKNDGIKS